MHRAAVRNVIRTSEARPPGRKPRPLPIRGVRGLLLLMIRRGAATPQLLAIRFAGVLVAVVLVAGVSLYSGAMGDAMLQQRIGTDPSNVGFAVSETSHSLTAATYAALDSYIRHGE